MATYTFAAVTNGVNVTENGGLSFVRPLGYDTLADGSTSVMIEQRSLGGGVWGRRILLTDTITIGGVSFSGTSAQLITALANIFDVQSNNIHKTGDETKAGVLTLSSNPVLGAMTQGSIPIISTGGAIIQNNTGLFFDNTNSRLGIGTVSPTRPITISKADSGNAALVSNTAVLRIINSNAGVNRGSGIQFSTDNTDAQTLAMICTQMTSASGQWTGDILFSTKVDTSATTLTEYMRIKSGGGIAFPSTNTTVGTTGAQTINKASGTVNFAAGAASLVVTNSLVTTSSIILPVVMTNDATAAGIKAVPASGSFTIYFGTTPTAETKVGFFVIN